MRHLWILCLLLVGPATAAERRWLPQPVFDAMVEQFAGRFGAFASARFGGGRPPDPDQLGAASRGAIEAMAETLEQWGIEGALTRAPDFDVLNPSPIGDPYLDAMARYQVCNIVLFLQLQDPERQSDNHQVTSILGLSALSAAIVYLRLPFVEAGGDQATIETLMTGPALATSLQAIQTDGAARARAESACQPIVLALVEAPLAGLRGGGESPEGTGTP